MIKAVFFDIDGTLLSHRTHQVPTSTKKAIQLLKEKGIYIFIATGRHISEIKALPLDDIECEGYITLNGQYCYNKNEVIYDFPIHPDDITNIIHKVEENPIPCAFIEKDIMYINYVNDTVHLVQKAISSPVLEIGDLNRGLTNPIYQVMTYGLNEDEEKNLLQHMPHCQYTHWHDYAIDIIPNIGGKQNGILKVMEYYHLSPEECMAFGDGHNDICMFNIIPLSIAMGNASQEVKDHAYEVTDDIDKDGLYNALIKHHIIQTKG